MKLKFLIKIYLIGVISSCHAQSGILPPLDAYFSALIVNDIDSSMNWYTTSLGCELINQINLEERGIKQANLNCGMSLIELIEIKGSIDPSTILQNKPRGTRLQGFFKFGFRVADFDGWMSHLVQSKTHIHGSVVNDPNSGKRMVVLLDPDGNRVQLFEQ